MRIGIIRSPILITDEGAPEGQFIASANGYEPFQFQADNIMQAMEMVNANLANFRQSAEAKAKSNARSIAAKKRWEQGGFGRKKTAPVATPVPAVSHPTKTSKV